MVTRFNRFTKQLAFVLMLAISLLLVATVQPARAYVLDCPVQGHNPIGHQSDDSHGLYGDYNTILTNVPAYQGLGQWHGVGSVTNDPMPGGSKCPAARNYGIEFGPYAITFLLTGPKWNGNTDGCMMIGQAQIQGVKILATAPNRGNLTSHDGEVVFFPTLDSRERSLCRPGVLVTTGVTSLFSLKCWIPTIHNFCDSNNANLKWVPNPPGVIPVDRSHIIGPIAANLPAMALAYNGPMQLGLPMSLHIADMAGGWIYNGGAGDAPASESALGQILAPENHYNLTYDELMLFVHE